MSFYQLIQIRIINLALISGLFCSFVSAQDIEINDSVPHCDFGGLVFDLSFSGARLNSCKQTDNREYSLSTSPENSPINHSPWYAFRIYSERRQNIDVYLHYNEHEHRYHPKVSSDGESWARLDDRDLEVLFDGKAIKLELEVGPEPIWISGQEILDNDFYQEWTENLGALPFLKSRVLGQSLRGRDISLIESAESREKYIVLVGRQHPPEVTGAIAMKFFIDRLTQSDQLAVRFREDYGVVMVPNLNPDGVELGNWRHNAGGVDLNRDWGPFEQPETQLMFNELSRFSQANGPSVDLFLDFHSTNRDVFYTQDEDTLRMSGFTDAWLANLQSSIQQDHPDYQVGIQPGHNPDLPVSKTYMNETFGIPAITFELGDETERAFIQEFAETAAEEMMTLLLSYQ